MLAHTRSLGAENPHELAGFVLVVITLSHLRESRSWCRAQGTTHSRIAHCSRPNILSPVRRSQRMLPRLPTSTPHLATVLAVGFDFGFGPNWLHRCTACTWCSVRGTSNVERMLPGMLVQHRGVSLVVTAEATSDIYSTLVSVRVATDSFPSSSSLNSRRLLFSERTESFEMVASPRRARRQSVRRFPRR